MHGLRILVVGDKNLAQIPEDLSASFAELGHEATFYHFYYLKVLHKLSWGFVNTPLKSTRKIGEWLMYKIMDGINLKLVSHAEIIKPDLIIVINGFTLDRKTVEKLKALNIRIINWVVDDPARARFSNFLESSGCYDLIFCCSNLWLSHIRMWNKNIYYLPLAVNLSKYSKLNPNLDPEFDVAFVGTFVEGDQSTNFRFILLNNISKLKIKLRVAGQKAVDYFSRRVKNNGNIILTNEQSLKEVINIYRNSKIIFNPFNTYNQDVVSLRVFEVGSMGVFQIVPFQESVEKMFSGEVVSFKDLKEMSEKIQLYINTPKKRLANAEKVYSIIKNNHTYLHRAKTILEQIKCNV